MKYFSILLLIIIYIIFVVFEVSDNTSFKVLEVITPTKIVVDYNKNGVKDNDEVLELKNIYSFSTKIAENKEAVEFLKLTGEDSLKLGYLAELFSKNLILGQKVEVKNNEIFIDGANYSELLVDKGLASNKNSTDNIFKIKENINQANKLNLVILNLKNLKFHNLDCKYGLQTKNFIIVPKSKLPPKASTCKYCKVREQNLESKIALQKVKMPYLDLGENDLKLILSDMTLNLQPRKDCSDRLCKVLVEEINKAKESIDFAIYGYVKIPEFEKALERAKNRGVDIRFVYDTNKNGVTTYPDTLNLVSKFNKNNSDKSNAIMHNKFFIFDTKRVYTGSANLSNTDMSGFNSNVMLLINSEDIAKTYKNEFEQMYNGKFHENKSVVEKYNKSNLRVYFSPSDKIIEKEVLPMIYSAKSYIYIPAFVLTHEKLANALIQAKNRKVDVKIILDATNTKAPSKLTVLRSAGIPVKTENLAGKLHSKSIIIDDKYLLIGSMNFSLSGENKNDENMIIVEDEKLTKFYKQFFMYLWAKIPNEWLKNTVQSESTDSIGSCYDGIDNDYDGKTDLADTGCKFMQN